MRPATHTNTIRIATMGPRGIATGPRSVDKPGQSPNQASRRVVHLIRPRVRHQQFGGEPEAA
jgi:hypothetical protein